MTKKDLEEFEKEFGFKLLPTGFKKPFIYRLALKYGLIAEIKKRSNILF